MYSAIIFLLSDQSIWLGTPGYSCHPVSSIVVKPLFLGTLWAEQTGPTQENQGKEASAAYKPWAYTMYIINGGFRRTYKQRGISICRAKWPYTL